MSIEKRIRRLEWTNRALVLVLLAVVLVAMTDEEPVADVIRCHRLEVLREDGNRGTSLGSEGLTIWGDQIHRARLTQEKLEILDEFRTQRINIDRRGLSVHGKSGKYLAAVGEYYGGSGAVSVYSEAGDRVVLLEGKGSTRTDSTGEISVYRAAKGDSERFLKISSSSNSFCMESPDGAVDMYPGQILIRNRNDQTVHWLSSDPKTGMGTFRIFNGTAEDDTRHKKYGPIFEVYCDPAGRGKMKAPK